MAEIALADVFVELADTLVDDFDVMDFLHQLTQRCVQVLDISAAGLLLADGKGALQAVTASSERTRLLELFQVQTGQGPCLDCFATGQPVSETDLTTADRWPRFAAAAGAVGFGAVHAVPMRLRNEIIGALNFFTVEPGALHASTVRVGQALADVATIGLLQQRAIRNRDTLTEQLQTALNSRILIEQAKGILAERLQVDPDQAFVVLRRGARSHNRRLSDLAFSIVVGATPGTATVPVPKPTPLAGPPARVRHDGDRPSLGD